MYLSQFVFDSLSNFLVLCCKIDELDSHLEGLFSRLTSALPCRITCNNCASGYVAYHQRSRTDQGARADFYTAHYDRATSNRRASSYYGPLHLPVALSLRLPTGDRRAWITIVNEDHPMTNEHLVLYCYPGADERVTRDLATVANGCVALNLDESTQASVISHDAAVEIHIW
jgi:hypothetical protein